MVEFSNSPMGVHLILMEHLSEPTHGEGGHWASNSSSEGSYNHGIYLQDYNVTSSPTTANRDINVANKYQYL